jgi:hypothetical protein
LPVATASATRGGSAAPIGAALTGERTGYGVDVAINVWLTAVLHATSSTATETSAAAPKKRFRRGPASTRIG